MKPKGAVEKSSKGSNRGPVITKGPNPKERIGEVNGIRRACCYRGLVQLMSEELMEKKMTIEIHKGESRGSERGHNRKREKDAKANGILKQWTDEEYEKEKSEIAVHLELLMELLQENMIGQRQGWMMRKRVKWYKLQ